MSSNGNTTYVANPADSNAFNAASKGSVYIEFDVPNSAKISRVLDDKWMNMMRRLEN